MRSTRSFTANSKTNALQYNRTAALWGSAVNPTKGKHTADGNGMDRIPRFEDLPKKRAPALRPWETLPSPGGVLAEESPRCGSGTSGCAFDRRPGPRGVRQSSTISAMSRSIRETKPAYLSAGSNDGVDHAGKHLMRFTGNLSGIL